MPGQDGLPCPKGPKTKAWHQAIFYVDQFPGCVTRNLRYAAKGASLRIEEPSLCTEEPSFRIEGPSLRIKDVSLRIEDRSLRIKEPLLHIDGSSMHIPDSWLG